MSLIASRDAHRHYADNRCQVDHCFGGAGAYWLAAGWKSPIEGLPRAPGLADPNCGFDAIVVGEYERAFAGRRLLDLLPILEQHGMQDWLPETHGRVDRHNPAHEALIMLLVPQC